MLRTDAADNVANQFTDGNPVTSTPATVIDSKWLNDKQEELVGLVESQNITPDQTGADQGQLREALGYENLSQTVVNNQVSALDVTNLLFDKVKYKAALVHYCIDRNTDTNELVEHGLLSIRYSEKADDWEIKILISSGDDAGVSFTIDSVGQVQYTSTDVTGASYSGNMFFNQIQRIIQ